MGKRRRERTDKGSADDERTVSTDAVSVRREPDDAVITSAWSADFVRDAIKEQLNRSIGTSDIGLQLARGTMEAMQKKSDKKHKQVQIKPSPIQLNMWPLMLDSLQSMCAKLDDKPTTCVNIIGIAQTGSGKTLSYCLPMVASCVCKLLTPIVDLDALVHGIVLCPTRELAIQVSKEIKTVMKVANRMIRRGIESEVELKVESIAVYGGVDINAQLASLGVTSDADVSCADNQQMSLTVAATPGRLLDILKQVREMKQTPAPFDDVSLVIFDEADRMALNAEMATQIDEILDILNEKNKNGFVSCLVSATLPQNAKEVIDRWVSCPRAVVKIDSVNVADKKHHDKNTNDETQAGDTNKSIETTQGSDSNIKPKRKLTTDLDLATIPSNLVQTLHVCANHKKPKKLITTLKRIYQNGSRSSGNKLSIVFFAQIKTLKFISNLLRKEGFKCVELFGTLKQEEREQRLLSFKAGKYPILLASDLASRGIHVPNVNYVVNYDFPGSLDQYVHRCGRAGRTFAKSEAVAASSPPTVYSFFTREFAPMADSVIELLRMCNSQVDPNLIALSSEKAAAGTETNSRKRRKRKDNAHGTTTSTGETKQLDGADVDHSDDDQFASLGNKIVLKRALHVSDAEDSNSNSE